MVVSDLSFFPIMRMPTDPRRQGKGPFWLVSDMYHIESRSVLVVKRDVEPTVAFHYDTPLKLNEAIARETLNKFESLMSERIYRLSHS